MCPLPGFPGGRGHTDFPQKAGPEPEAASKHPASKCLPSRDCTAQAEISDTVVLHPPAQTPPRN